MELLAYVRQERGRATRIAVEIAVRPVMVHQWARGVKPVPVARCMQIERATGGAVTRAELRRDDYHIHWPDLPRPGVAPKGGGIDADGAVMDVRPVEAHNP